MEDSAMLVKQLAAAFRERSIERELKGKKRDEALVDYMCGAAAALLLAGQKEKSAAVQSRLVFDFSLRGYKACEDLANNAKAPNWNELMK